MITVSLRFSIKKKKTNKLHQIYQIINKKYDFFFFFFVTTIKFFMSRIQFLMFISFKSYILISNSWQQLLIYI